MIYSNLNKILKDNDISVNHLSTITGLSRTTLTKLVKNSFVPKETRISTMSIISVALKLPMDMIFPYRYKTNCFSLRVINERPIDDGTDDGTIKTVFSRLKMGDIDRNINVLTEIDSYKNDNLFIIKSNFALKGDLKEVSLITKEDFSDDINTNRYVSTFLSNINDYQAKQIKNDITDALIRNKIIPIGARIEHSPNEPVNLVSINLGNQLINLSTPYKIIDFNNKFIYSSIGFSLKMYSK